MFKNYRKYFLAAFLPLALLLAVCPMLAQAVQATVQHKLFYMPNGKELQLKPYLELYWQINPNTISFNQEDDGWRGRVKADIVVSDEHGIVEQEHYVLETKALADQQQISAQKLIDLRRYLLTTGKLHIEIRFSDVHKKGNEFQYTDTFSISNTASVPFFSDIQIVDTAVESTERGVFQRNGQLQIPLAINFLDEQRKTLHYYAELYNTHNVSAEHEPVTQKVFISKGAFDAPLHQLVRIDTVASSLLQIIDGNFLTASLPSGNYHLNMILEGKDQQRLASKTLFFQIMNSNPTEVVVKNSDTATSSKTPETFVNLNKTFVAKYTSTQIRAILKMLMPVANAAERNVINEFLKRPDEMYSRYFIYNFWLAKNRMSPEKEWKDYAEKIKEVNRLFGSSLMPGYESERGITYLKYGKPDERTVVMNENGALPYEVWLYNALPQATNAVFLFYRPGFVTNEYRILHSTVNGEVRNKNWRSVLYVNGTAGDSYNSRAEQYIGNR